MPLLFEYLLKLSIGLAAMFVFYYLVLRKLTFYHQNRWYLLGYSIICFFIALIDIGWVFGSEQPDQIIRVIPSINGLSDFFAGTGKQAVTESKGMDIQWSLLGVVLVVGAVFFLIRLLIQVTSLKRITRSAELIVDGEYKFYHVEKDIMPFSFGNAVYVNAHLHSEEELKKIVRHELVHVKQKHSVDMIWGEILVMLNWYNPFAWLIRQSIRQNLEFIADQQVLESGLDKKYYQYLLLKVIGNHHFSVSPHFNFTSLKKRIAMMNKMRSAKKHLFKFLFILPLVSLSLLAFRTNRTTKPTEAVLDLSLMDTTPVKSIKGEVKEITVVGYKTPQKVEGVKLSEPVKEISIVPAKPQLEEVVVEEIPIKGKVTGLEIKPTQEVTIVGYGTRKKVEGVQIDPVKAPLQEVTVIGYATKPTTFEGTVNYEKKPAEVIIRGYKAEPKNQMQNFFQAIPNCDKDPLFILDGIEISKTDMEAINPNNIESISILKGESAGKYGEKGKNGVILINTKKKKVTPIVDSVIVTRR